MKPKLTHNYYAVLSAAADKTVYRNGPARNSNHSLSNFENNCRVF